MSESSPVLVLVRDLMFSSKISATARASGRPIRTVRNPADLSGLPGDLLIADLSLPGALEAAADWQSQAPNRQTIAFAPHTDTQIFESARAAGLTQVLPRSRFTQQLPQILQPSGGA